VIALAIYTVEFKPPSGLTERQWWMIVNGLTLRRSFSEIGRDIGRNKNVVVGIVHRCHLQSTSTGQRYRDWTAEEDRTILLYAGAHASAASVLAGRSKDACKLRWERIRDRASSDMLVMDDEHPLTKYGREPYRAGHPLTWGAINQGTVLEGAPFDDQK
jgi:hypothetical protein